MNDSAPRALLRVSLFASILAFGSGCGSSDDEASPTTNDTTVDAGNAENPVCSDGTKNGSESDVDCGGSCSKCAVGKTCNTAADCASGVCTGGKCAAPSKPNITSFKAEKSRVTSGKETTLTAVYTGGTGTVDHGVGAITSAVAKPSGPVSAKTTFKLTVTNAAGESVSAETDVDVVAAPLITSFTAAAPKVSRFTAGSLTGVFSGGTGSIDKGIGAVTSGAVTPTANLPAKTTFTLTVTNELLDAVTATVDVDVKREMFITNYSANTLFVLDEDATGAAAPKRTIAGGNTTFSDPRGLSVVNDEIFVANDAGNSVLVFNLGDNGDVAPKRTISGGTTTLSDPCGLFVKGTEIFIGNRGAGSIAVWNTTDNGDVAPKRAIAGPSTNMAQPNGVFVDGNEIYVAREGTSGFAVFPVNGTGDIAPTRAFTGVSATGVMVVGNEVFLTSQNTPASITAYNKTSGAQLRQIVGPATTFGYYSEQCAVLGTDLLCASWGSNTILGFPLNGDGDIAPTRTITGVSGPLGLYIY